MRMRATVSASLAGTPRARYMPASSRRSPTGSWDNSSSFNVDFVSHQVVVGPHRNEFPRGHRESPGKQARYSGYSYGSGAGTRTGNSEDE